MWDPCKITANKQQNPSRFNRSVLNQPILREKNNTTAKKDNGGDRKLKYNLPDMSSHDIGEFLSYEELSFIAGDICTDEQGGGRLTPLQTTNHWMIRRKHDMTSSLRHGMPNWLPCRLTVDCCFIFLWYVVENNPFLEYGNYCCFIVFKCCDLLVHGPCS